MGTNVYPVINAVFQCIAFLNGTCSHVEHVPMPLLLSHPSLKGLFSNCWFMFEGANSEHFNFSVVPNAYITANILFVNFKALKTMYSEEINMLHLL